MVKVAHQNKEGGLNKRGRDHINRTTGSKLKAPVKSGDNPRSVLIFLSTNGLVMKGPERDSKMANQLDFFLA